MQYGMHNVSSSAVHAWGYYPDVDEFVVIYNTNKEVAYVHHGITEDIAQQVFDLGEQSIGAKAMPFLRKYGSSQEDASEYPIGTPVPNQRRAMIRAGLDGLRAQAWL